jgi:hypothetical protein
LKKFALSVYKYRASLTPFYNTCILNNTVVTGIMSRTFVVTLNMLYTGPFATGAAGLNQKEIENWDTPSFRVDPPRAA